MTFTVTYRAKDGALSEETVEAADRAACVAACRARGFAPVSVREGRASARPRSGKSSASPKQKLFTLHFYLFVVIAAIAAIALWWWLASRGNRADAREERSGKSAASPKSAAKRPEPVAKRPEPAATNAPAVVHVADTPTAAPTGKVIKARSARSGRVMTLADGTVVTNTPRVFFKRDFERALHVALLPNGMGGTLLRQVRARYTNEQILAMLKERVPPEPGDDPTTVAVKEKVQNFKDEVLRVVNQGASVAEVLDGMTKRKVADGLLRAKALKIRTEALRSEDPETARQGIQAANAVLEENGLRKMEIPQKFKKSDTPADGGAGENAEGGKVSEDQTQGDKQQ